MNLQDESTKGFFLALAAFMMWGVFPIYFKMFDESISPWQILAHRIIWSVVFMAFILYFMGGFKQIKALMINSKTRNLLFVSGLMISLNWGIYVYAVSNSQILEASLGYFMNPLVNIFVGFLVFKERVSSCGKVGVFMVFMAVLIQIYAMKTLPVISLMLPISFAIYICIRKFIKVAALDGLFIETLLMFPFAAGYFLYLVFVGDSHFKADTNGVLMAFSGIVTIVPLIMFNAATTRMKLTTLAYMQYISPSISIFIAVVLFKESLEIYKIISFGLIWSAIALVSLENAINLKRKRI